MGKPTTLDGLSSGLFGDEACQRGGLFSAKSSIWGLARRCPSKDRRLFESGSCGDLNRGDKTGGVLVATTGRGGPVDRRFATGNALFGSSVWEFSFGPLEYRKATVGVVFTYDLGRLSCSKEETEDRASSARKNIGDPAELPQEESGREEAL